MRRKGLWLVFVVCSTTLHFATAQQQMGTQQMSLGQNQSITAAILQPVSGAPYQADKVTHSVQTLSDGTVITHETRGLIARDAEGRMREDLYQVHSGNVNGRQMEREFQSATVGDPVGHTMLIWTGDKTKIAMQMQLPSLPKLPLAGGVAGILATPPPPVIARGPNGEVPMIKEDAPPPDTTVNVYSGGQPSPAAPHIDSFDAAKDDVRTEELGQQSIEGVLVTGKRITTTIPTGKVGNDRPIVVVHEEWRSPELKIVVKTIDADPRTGKQTMELEGISRADPDPALFQAPVGYQVKDIAQMMKALGDIGKPKTQ